MYLATDPDREGEFIAWRLSELFADWDTPRVTFNEITPEVPQHEDTDEPG